MTTSLSQFCKSHNLPKSSVYVRCQELGIPTSNGLDDEAIAILKSEFNVAETVEVPTVEESAGQLTVFVNASQPGSLAMPELPKEFDLAKIHTSDIQAIEDPLAVATQFLQIADQIQTAMESDIQAKEAKIHATRTAKAQIVERANELKLEQRFYKERAKQADSVLSEETSDLQNALTLLQKLGKQNSSAA